MLDPRLEQALQRLRITFPSGFEQTVCSAHCVHITLADGGNATVRLDPATGVATLAPRYGWFIKAANAFGTYLPGPGWLVRPANPRSHQQRLHPDNFDNLLG